MNDLISRSALLDDIQAAEENAGMGAVIAGTLKRYVKRAPTVDAVEVVRCKDCEWGIVSARNPLIKWCNKHATHFKNNDFCSYGERRDGDATD